jgi:DNA-binding CsgD family transcriptional regulator
MGSYRTANQSQVADFGRAEDDNESARRTWASHESDCPIDGLGADPAKTEVLVRYRDELIRMSHNMDSLVAARDAAAAVMRRLTPRQIDVLEMVLAGVPSKIIAADLCISQRTVENHRAAIMTRTGSKSIPELARMALSASLSGGHDVR